MNVRDVKIWATKFFCEDYKNLISKQPKINQKFYNASEIVLAVVAHVVWQNTIHTVLVLGSEPRKCAFGIKYAITSPNASDHYLK